MTTGSKWKRDVQVLVPFVPHDMSGDHLSDDWPWGWAAGRGIGRGPTEPGIPLSSSLCLPARWPGEKCFLGKLCSAVSQSQAEVLVSRDWLCTAYSMARPGP